MSLSIIVFFLLSSDILFSLLIHTFSFQTLTISQPNFYNINVTVTAFKLSYTSTIPPLALQRNIFFPTISDTSSKVRPNSPLLSQVLFRITHSALTPHQVSATIIIKSTIPVGYTMNITLRQSHLSGVARATIPDKQSHLVTNYCTMFWSIP